MKKTYISGLMIGFSLIIGACGSDSVTPPVSETSARATVPDTSVAISSEPITTEVPAARTEVSVKKNMPKADMARAHKHDNPPAATGIPFANTIDYICDMQVMADYTDTCHYKGKVYAFCSEYCKDTFKENPEKYLKSGQ